jgi:hypothetical protein
MLSLSLSLSLSFWGKSTSAIPPSQVQIQNCLLVTNSSNISNRDYWIKQFATSQLVKSFAPTRRRRIPSRTKESRSSSQRNFRKRVT